MDYISTRNANTACAASRAIVQGLAADGGLLTPSRLPLMGEGFLDSLRGLDYQGRAAKIMGLFLDEFSHEELAGFADKAYGRGKFDAPGIAPVRAVDGSTSCLELWHGPTCAFKDMALQMLPHLLTASLVKTRETKTVCILVATSGDTGKGALEGFRDVDGTRILVFYPKDGVSAVQQLQMTTQQGNNVGVCSVAGNFDDAQTGVKTLFSDADLRAELARRGYFLSSANSINWGRVLPQIVYYISAYCDLLDRGAIAPGERINVCVPTGNFGNILAAYYAGEMGLPLGKLICASNSNNVLTDFLRDGVYDRNRKFYQTISPSMDILISSNLERLLFAMTGDDAAVRSYMAELAATGRYQVDATLRDKIRAKFAAGCCDDDRTRRMIGRTWAEHRYLIDPHTAVAFHVLEQYRAETGDRAHTLVASTASAFKFCDSVLDALGCAAIDRGLAALDQLAALTGAPVPAPLAALKDKPVRFDRCVPKDRMVDAVLEMLH